MDTPLLWHIPLSHYNEKVRWALDHKGIAHRRRVAPSDYLFRAWRATGQGKLPVLWIDGRAIADSTRIIAELEARHPGSPLYPADAEARKLALAIEDDLDETLGPALRASIVTPLFRHDPRLGMRMLMTGMSRNYEVLSKVAAVFPAFYRFRHRIRDDALDADRATVAAALDRIEQQRQGRAYLVGDAFSVADLTAAALISPLLQPAQIQYPVEIEWPDYIAEYRAGLLRHPAFVWAAEIYRKHRGRSAEIHRRAAAEEARAVP